LPSFFWRVGEEDFPERSYMKASRDSDFSLGAFYALFSLNYPFFIKPVKPLKLTRRK
jgi:hypothetical protein